MGETNSDNIKIEYMNKNTTDKAMFFAYSIKGTLKVVWLKKFLVAPHSPR